MTITGVFSPSLFILMSLRNRLFCHINSFVNDLLLFEAVDILNSNNRARWTKIVAWDKMALYVVFKQGSLSHPFLEMLGIDSWTLCRQSRGCISLVLGLKFLPHLCYGFRHLMHAGGGVN